MVNSINKLVNAKEFVDKYLPSQIVTSMKVNAKMDKKEMDMDVKYIVMEIITQVFGRMIKKMEKEKKFMLRLEKQKKESGKMENSKVEKIDLFSSFLKLLLIYININYIY